LEKKDVRIIILTAYEPSARALLCEAYRRASVDSFESLDGSLSAAVFIGISLFGDMTCLLKILSFKFDVVVLAFLCPHLDECWRH